MASKKRKPSTVAAVPAPAVRARSEKRYIESADLRMRAERDYIRDPDGNGSEWHYKHGGFDKYISLATFQSWHNTGNWASKRVEYWRRIQDRLLDHLADKILDARIRELGDMKIVSDAIVEMLMPLRDEKGEVRRDPVTKQPLFAVPLPPYDRLVKAYLDLDMRMGLRTGDVTDRVAVTDGRVSRVPITVEGTPVVTDKPVTPQEAQMLARQLLLSRHASLQGDADAIDVESEDGDA